MDYYDMLYITTRWSLSSKLVYQANYNYTPHKHDSEATYKLNLCLIKYIKLSKTSINHMDSISYSYTVTVPLNINIQCEDPPVMCDGL